METYWITTDECGACHIFLQKPHRYKNIWMPDNETKHLNDSFHPLCESMHPLITIPLWCDNPIEVII